MSHVFVSYARQDRAFVDRLVAALERHEFDAWIDREDIAGGAAWEATIGGAVRDSAAVIVVMSPAAAASEYVPRELSIADKYDRPVVPVLLQPWEAVAHDTEHGRRLEFQLAGLQYVDFARRSFETAMQDLLRALRAGEAAGPARPPTAPAARSRRGVVLAVLAAVALLGLVAAFVRGRSAPPPVVAGRWQAEVTYPWGVRVKERFEFVVDGDQVSGTASFLGVPRGVLDGRLADGRLAFRTAIAAGPLSPAFSNAYRGRLDGRALQLVLQDDRGNPPVEITAARVE